MSENSRAELFQEFVEAPSRRAVRAFQFEERVEEVDYLVGQITAAALRDGLFDRVDPFRAWWYEKFVGTQFPSIARFLWHTRRRNRFAINTLPAAALVLTACERRHHFVPAELFSEFEAAWRHGQLTNCSYYATAISKEFARSDDWASAANIMAASFQFETTLDYYMSKETLHYFRLALSALPERRMKERNEALSSIADAAVGAAQIGDYSLATDLCLLNLSIKEPLRVHECLDHLRHHRPSYWYELLDVSTSFSERGYFAIGTQLARAAIHLTDLPPREARSFCLSLVEAIDEQALYLPRRKWMYRKSVGERPPSAAREVQVDENLSFSDPEPVPEPLPEPTIQREILSNQTPVEGASKQEGRVVNAWVSTLYPLLGQPFDVAVSIGAPQSSSRSSAHFREPSWGAFDSLEILISLSSEHCQIEPASHLIVLPKLGDTEKVRFSCRSDRAGSVEFRIKIHLAKTLLLLQLHTFSIEIDRNAMRA